MSIGGFTVGEAALAEQPSEPSKKTPPKRQTVAKADPAIQPEPR